jgi:hypothetical protein
MQEMRMNDHVVSPMNVMCGILFPLNHYANRNPLLKWLKVSSNQSRTSHAKLAVGAMKRLESGRAALARK